MRFINLLVVNAVFLLLPPLAAQIPIHPNHTDNQGRKQGMWIILYDKEGKQVADTLEMHHYRVSNYMDNKAGWVMTDYYKSGEVMAASTKISDDSTSQRVTMYNQDGIKEYEAVLKNGSKISTRKYFYTDGSAIADSLDVLNNMAKTLFDAGKYQDAVVAMEKTKIVAYYQAGRKGRMSLRYANILNRLAMYYYSTSAYEKAEPLFLETREILIKAEGKESKDYATLTNNLASLYLDQGQFSKAEVLFQEAKEIMLRTVGKSDPTYAFILANLSKLHQATGNYADALKLGIEAKELRETILGKHHPDYAASINILAGLYQLLGNYSNAEQFYMEGTQLLKELRGKDHPEYATALNDMAVFYKTIGNYSKAELFYKQAIEIKERTIGKQHPQYATAIGNLAVVYMATGNLSKVEPLLVEAKEITKNTLGKDHSDYAVALSNLAMFYKESNQPLKALPLFIEALGIYSKTLGDNHPAFLAASDNLAQLYSSIGNLSAAEALHEEIVKAMEGTLGKDHPDYILSLQNLAVLYFEEEKYSRAAPLFLEVIERKKQQLVRYFPFLSEKEKQNYYTSNRLFFSNFVAFCIEQHTQSPKILGELFNLKLATKGLLFNTSDKIRKRILTSNNQSLIEQFNIWQAKKDLLVKVYQMPLDEKLKKGLNENILEEEINTIEKDLSLKSEGYKNIADNRKYRWEDVQQKLKAGEVAIEIAVTKKRIKEENVIVYAALIVTPQTKNHPGIVILENGTDLEGKFSKFYRNAVKQKIKDELSYNQYWKPIADNIKGVQKIYFSADGVYNQINLNTLYNPATGKYVIDEVEIQVVTSTKDLITNTKATRLGIKDATLFGYPNYNNHKPTIQDSTRSISFSHGGGGFPFWGKGAAGRLDSAQRFFDGENINELPGTKTEVETISFLLKKKNIAILDFIFDEATESQIKKLNNPQVLHIATHGFFLSDAQTSNNNERGFAGIETKKMVENPLLRSGLLFAGVKNAFAKSGTATSNEAEDGILTAYEAMNLDLDQTNLVVMSACETGLGVTANGEGVYGLQRAFQVAGSKSVLMSLWTVSDEATQQLMTMFYENWLGGKTLRESFRMAQLSLREKYPEPYYWGAFVLVGN